MPKHRGRSRPGHARVGGLSWAFVWLARVFVRQARAWARLHECALAERGRWALWLPVALGVGVGVYFSLRFEPPLWAGVVGASGLAVVAWGCAVQNRGGAAFVLMLAAVAGLGVTLAGARAWWVSAPMLAAETGPATVTGQVAVVEPRPSGARVTLERVRIERLAPGDVPERVRVSLNGAQPDFQPGDWLRMTANLSAPPGPATPGAFDFQRQSYFRALGGVGFAYGPVAVIDRAPTQGGGSLAFGLERLRLHLAERINARHPGAAGAVAAALMTGVRSAIPEPVMEAMRASGLAHLLAISGLHVGLVAGIVFFAARLSLVALGRWSMHWPVKKLAAVAALAAALFYTLLAGATVPTQRAFLMVGVVLLAVLVDRRALSMRSVAWAAVLVLLIAPEALLGASFQLSFAAVVALVAVYETLRAKGIWTARADRAWVRAARYVGAIALTTAVAGLATAAFAAFHFNRVADYGLAANLFAVPVVGGWIMPWAVAAFGLMPLGLEGLALAPMVWGVEWVLAVAETVSSWPGAHRVVPAFPAWGLVCVALGGLWAAIWQGKWRSLGALAVAAGMLSVWTVRAPDVLIDDSADLAAVKTATGGYAVSTLRAKAFERDVWLRRAGLTTPGGRWQAATLAESGPLHPGAVRCDGAGCVYLHPFALHPSAWGQSVAFSQAPEALVEDCLRARVVVNLGPPGWPEACAGTVRIDARDLARGGTHALWFEANGAVRIETVNDRRGFRPWVINGVEK